MTAVNALSTGSRMLIASSAAPTVSAALTEPARTARAISAAEMAVRSVAIPSGLEHRGRFGLVRQFELGNQRAHAKRDREFGLDRVAPSRLDGQRERLRSRVDIIVECLARRGLR